MRIQIKPYAPQDFDCLAQIHDPARRCELACAGLSAAFLPLSIAAEREGLFTTYSVFVAWRDDTPVGFIAFNREEIGWLYVDVNFARQGIGTQLLRFALPRISADAEIEVLAGNAPALGLYTSLGFRIRETVHGVMPGNESFPVTVHVLTRPQTAAAESV